MRSSEGSTSPSAGVNPVIVALPGTGSDADYARRAFGGTDATVIAVEPGADGLVQGYERALDDAARSGRQVLAAGISIGACVAMQWALANPGQCAGVLAALPPWLGAPDAAPRPAVRRGPPSCCAPADSRRRSTTCGRAVRHGWVLN
jgi:pimeloyl-ACP methyl ester carboxylesterase